MQVRKSLICLTLMQYAKNYKTETEK